ncbi:hypothetical protein GF336_00355 [Candidatus Woesearchaeota archaeon]|nr:hypothetical protein [Candidatus Woesearchaeota archaeon]
MTILFHDSEALERGDDFKYRPSYDDANDVKLVCMRKKGNKKSKFFNFEKGDKIKDVRSFIEKQINSDHKRGRQTIVINHYWNYDICYLTKGERHNTYRWDIIRDIPFIMDFRKKLTEEEVEGFRKDAPKCPYCKVSMREYDVNDYFVQFKCPLCKRNRKRDKHARFLDSMNFFSMSLAKLGEIIGHSKMEMPKSVYSLDDVKEYCENDVIILEKAWSYLMESMSKLGYNPRNPITISKLGYNLLQYVCSKEKIIKNGREYSQYDFLWNRGKIRSPTKEPEFVKACCRGGRLERFAMDNGVFKASKLDINSAYPFVCVHRDFPDPMTEKVIEFPDEDILNELGCVRATVKSPKAYVGYLPINYNNKRIYPTDVTLTGVWTIFELRNAIKKYGYKLISMDKAVVYKKLPFNLFKSFYNRLYKIKSKNIDNLKPIAKLIMNGTTGKFIQRDNRMIRKIIRREDMPKYAKEGFSLKTMVSKTGDYIIEKKVNPKGFSKNAHPIIYAHITAYSRDYLYEHLIKIPPKDLLYCATDSIMFKNKDHIKNFKIGEKLGEWKVEAIDKPVEFFENECFHRVGDEIKANGIRRGTANLKSLRENGKVERRQLFTMKMALKTGKFEKVGKFFKNEVSLKGIPRRRIKYPPYIEEVLPSEFVRHLEETMEIRNI